MGINLLKLLTHIYVNTHPFFNKCWSFKYPVYDLSQLQVMVTSWQSLNTLIIFKIKAWKIQCSAECLANNQSGLKNTDLLLINRRASSPQMGYFILGWKITLFKTSKKSVLLWFYIVRIWWECFKRKNHNFCKFLKVAFCGLLACFWASSPQTGYFIVARLWASSPSVGY